MKTTKPKVKTINKAAFDKMSVYEQRVAIAKDVLEQLKIGKYVPTRGVYVDVRPPHKSREQNYADTKYKPAKPLINKKDNTCYVCAKGAIICSYVRNFNNATIGNITSGFMVETNKIFGREILNVLEAKFESFGEFYRNARSPLKQLMQNIVRNKGVYKDSNGCIYGRSEQY